MAEFEYKAKFEKGLSYVGPKSEFLTMDVSDSVKSFLKNYK